MGAHATSEELVRLVGELQRPDAFPHPVTRFEVVETHISVILLTGEYAYKFKKPVRLEFLDFSTAARREHFCREEVRLNRRLAPELYRGVVAVTAGSSGPRIGGEGRTLWHAVQMRQFDREGELDKLVPRGDLTRGQVEAMASDVAAFHERCPHGEPDSTFGSPDCVAKYFLECFDEAAPCVLHDSDGRFSGLKHWATQALDQSRKALVERQGSGFIREGHGDLHLGNLLLLEGRVVAFDCLEFNDELRWIDVMNDVAFLMMDLDYHGRHELAAVFLSGYLERTGDYSGLGLVRLYQVYRAMVRAKVACITAQQQRESGRSPVEQHSQVERHLALAHAYLQPAHPGLFVTCGLSGSGKSTLAAGLVGPLGAIRIRSDVERKRLAGVPLETAAGADIDQGLYGPDMTRRTYERLMEIAESVLADGWSVIVDAAFLRQSEREDFAALADRRSVPFAVLYCRAPATELRRRLDRRAKSGDDVSDATVAVLEHQLRTAELPDSLEAERTVAIDTVGETDYERLADRLLAR